MSRSAQHGGNPSTANREMLVRARALTGFTLLVRAQGGNPAALLRHAGLTPRVLDQPDATLPLEAMTRLFERSARSLDLPDFGLRLSRYQDISVLGAIALLARHAATVGDALRGISRNFSYHTASARLQLQDDERPGYTQLRYETDHDPRVPRRQVLELSIAVAHGFLLLMTGDAGKDWQVSFMHGAGLPLARYRKFFGCPVGFAAEADMIAFPARLLAVPIDAGNPRLPPLVRQDTTRGAAASALTLAAGWRTPIAQRGQAVRPAGRTNGKGPCCLKMKCK